MEPRQLGRSGINVSPIVLGTWAIGGWMWGNTNEKASIEAILTSIDNGIFTIDTAAIYGMGLSEEIVGKAIQGRRDKVVVATKCGMRWDSEDGSDPWPQQDMQGKPVVIRKNARADSIVYEWEQSIKRLGVDYIDLFQIHWPDTSTPIEESWETMAKLKKEGKVRAIGVSNYSLEQLRLANSIEPVDSIQPPYSLIRRGIEVDLVPFCKENNIAIICYSPLERGLLTGKIKIDQGFPAGDHRRENPTFSKENREKVNAALEALHPIAEKHQATLAQIIIQTTIHQPGITTAIVGARNAQQAVENAKALQIQLSEEEKNTILNALDFDKK